jgi:hypothetical protein
MSTQKDRIFFLKNGRSPLTYLLPSVDKPKSRLLYFDKVKDETRALRYARNQKSPFIDEQDANVILEAIVFTDGKLIVSPNNPELLKFLLIHPLLNEVFEEYDPEKAAADALKRDELIDDAIVKFRDLDIEQMKVILRNFTDLHVSEMSVSEIKLETRRIARNWPQDFLDSIDDPQLEMDNIAIRAMEDGFVTTRNKGKELWFNTKEKKSRLMIVPHDVKPITAFASWLVSNDGNEFFEYLQKYYDEQDASLEE